MTVKKLINKYTDLLVAVMRDHEKVKASESSHDFEHALMVANYGARIAEDKKTAELAWVAGLLHNTDHLVERGIFPKSFSKKHEPEVLIRKKLVRCLRKTKLNDKDRYAVVEAVLEHKKLNDKNDSKATIALKDADRLANVGALLCIRSAKNFKHLPVLDYIHLFRHSSATYRYPQSVAKDIWYSLEWKKWLRLPKAKKLGIKRFAFLKSFLRDIEGQLKESGLEPYPFPRYKKLTKR